MKTLRKWSRILHRDLGFLFIGTSIIYGLSGIALNHLGDWNPNYLISQKQLTFKSPLKKSEFDKATFIQELSELEPDAEYVNHYFPREDFLKVFLDGKSSLMIDTETGKGDLELVKKRPVFYEVNYLHYNPNTWWKWFSDIFAGVLILLAVTSLFMVRGKKGIRGRGGIYLALGILIPLLILFLT